MYLRHIYRNPSGPTRRLIFFYGGWAMDPRPFQGLGKPGYDTIMAWDYTSLDFDSTPLRDYDEAVVLAWSFGVFAAAATANHLPVAVTCRIAVGGTLWPVDDEIGIPRELFWGTLENLTPASLRRFYRRICANADQYEEFMAVVPRRDIDDITAELEAIPRHIRACELTALGKRWDYALIPVDDRVFPPLHQQRAWESHGTAWQMLPAAHLPSLSHIIDRYVIDKELVERRFGRAVDSYDPSTAIQAAMARSLGDYLGRLCASEMAEAYDVLEAGSGSGYLTDVLAAMLPKGHNLLAWDLVDYGVPRPEDTIFERRDAEMAIRELPYRSLDMVASGATLQWFNSPGAFLFRASRTLRDGGIIAFSTFSRGNLAQVADIVGDTLPFIAYGRLDSLVPPGMDVVLMKQASVTRYFDSPAEVLEHLRLSGVNAVASQARPLEMIHRIVRQYPRIATGPHRGQCPLTYCPVYVILRKKPQP